MRIVTSKEISSFKILPFDIYNETGSKIFSAGEVLTPGKIIMLKNYVKLFTEDFDNEAQEEQTGVNKEGTIQRLTNFSYETIDSSEFETILNRECVLDSDTQIKLKYYCRKVLDLFIQGYFEEGVMKVHSLVGVLISTIFKDLKRSSKGSQVRFLGEYELCHPLNVAIVSGLIASKLDYQTIELEQLLLAAFLHDIGKFLLKNDNLSLMLAKEEESVAEHTKLGYDLIKNRLKLPEKVAKVALEHHENNDGSGYPSGLSNDFISEYSQIVNVANYYDNLACNRGTTYITCNRDAPRAMLEVGTKRFSAKMLYTFIHMFTYDDVIGFSEMAL